MPDAPNSQLDALAALALPEGGWGYVPHQPAHLEPTCLAMLALSADAGRFGPQLAAAERFLQSNAVADGSYRLARGRAEAVWPTAQVLFTFAALGRPGLERSAGRLLTHRGRVLAADPEVADMIDIDVRLVGWPWAEGNFSWVEPTAWAVLALRRAGRGAEPAVAEGMRLLLDRAFDDGGINYGNRLVLGRMTEPIPTPTALMLLALQGVTHPRITAALEYLRKQTASATDLEHLGWAKLAFAGHGRTDAAGHADSLIRKLLAQTSAPLPQTRHALALLALNSANHNPFHFAEAVKIDAQSPAAPPNTEAPKPPVVDRVMSKVRGFFISGLGGLRTPPPSAIHIADAPDYDAGLTAILKRQFEHFRAAVPLAGKRVVLKPNLVEYHRGKVINTDPRVVGAVIELCKAEGAADVVVAEGPGHWRNVQFLVEESGLGDVLRAHQVPFVDLNHDEPVKTPNMGRLTGLDYLYLAQTVVNAEVLISLPKLKTHHWAGATLSLKNLFGTLPGICYGWPKNELHWRGIPQSIIDIALTCTPHLAIVDGIVGMEGDGPLNGTARPMGVLVMGADLVAVDATCCRLMGLDPQRVAYLELGRRKKLGRLFEQEIPQLGESITARRQEFALPPKIEKHLLAKPA